KPKYADISDSGKSISVTTCVRGTTSTWPLKTGRISRKAAAVSVEATRKPGAAPDAIEQNRHSGTMPRLSGTRVGEMTHGFDTLAIHAGQEPDPVTGAVVLPIFQTSTYAQDAVGSPRLGYEYSRTTNPTRDSLQECLAALEGGRRALTFASGLAAEDTLLRTV